MKNPAIDVQVQFKFDHQKNFWKEQEAKELARVSALQNKASRSDETLSSPRVHSPRSDFSLTRAKSSGGFNRLGVIHNQFSAALPNPTPSNANTPNSIPDQKAQNQQAKGQKDSNDEVTSENEVITIPMPTRRQSSNTLHHQVISHANANVSTQTSSSSSLQNNSNIIPESNKEILHMEAAWLEFMNEVRKQVKSNTDEDTKQKEILEIQNKTQEIEKLKAKILELSATLLEEEKLIEKFENENNELQQSRSWISSKTGASENLTRGQWAKEKEARIMPVISVNKKQLYSLLDTSYEDANVEEFEDLCFAFGVEVDEIVRNDSGEITDFKIEIPANRYDLLCIEGLSMALRFFIGKEPVAFRYEAIRPETPQQMIVKASTGQRPVVVCAVLRGVEFNADRYDSFIQLQDKLHHNICRKRKLASIGTHDLDTISGPFEYACLPPNEINFVPLNQTKSVDGHGLMELLSKHEQLSEYLPLIRENPTYPVIHDKNRQVLSLPPIINSEHSKIRLTTKNVFIEVTAIDYTKANIVLNIMCTMFSQYCEKRFQVEQVEIIEEETKKTSFTPVYEYRDVNVDLDYLSTGIGVQISKDLVQGYLHKMQLESAVRDNSVVVTVPPTRSDILHPCDILEDVAIGYGFNTILEKATAPKTLCHGRQQPVNMLSDRLRRELAMAGFTEVLTFSLCSRKENFDYLNVVDDNVCVTIDNPQNQSFQVCRTSLYPGLLKTLKNSKKLALPISIFEVSDIVKLDPTNDIGSSNVRALCAMVMGIVDIEFEIVHGLLDRIMGVLDILHEIQYKEWIAAREKEAKEGGKLSTKVYNSYYYIKEGKNPTYLPGRCAEVRLKTDIKNNKEVSLGYLGLLHPDVATNFSISGMIAAIHLDVSILQQVFLQGK